MTTASDRQRQADRRPEGAAGRPSPRPDVPEVALPGPPAGPLRRVLMVARVFPPFQSVGHSLRVVKFIKYLPALGWLPSVLTIDDRKEYEGDRRQGSDSLLVEIPSGVNVERTRAGEPSWAFLERERRFGQRNWLTRIITKVTGGCRRWAYRNLLVPDRCVLWLPFAVHRGRRIVRTRDVEVIFATCPPYSASLVGACLKRVTGKPLVLDFRDDWVGTPWYASKGPVLRLVNRWLESLAVRAADKVILVTEWSRTSFLQRYPLQADKFVLIPNGCDLEEFTPANDAGPVPPAAGFTILHAGTLNDAANWGRTPAALFRALHAIVQRDPSLAGELRLAFTGALPQKQRQLVTELGLSSMVKELGFLPREEFLHVMQTAGMLLVINYDGYATLIPGKIYEYWAVGGPPILLLSCPGAASDLVQHYALGTSADPGDSDAIERAVLTAYQRSKTQAPMRVGTAGIERFDRKALAQQLGNVLSEQAGVRS